VDLACVLTAILVVIILGLLALPRTRESQASCSNNLRALGIAFASFAEDNANAFPHMLSTNDGGSLEYTEIPTANSVHFGRLDQYLTTAMVLNCPADSRDPAPRMSALENRNISYFYGLDGDPNDPRSLLAGDRNISTNSEWVVSIDQSQEVAWAAALGLHGRRGYLLFSDGSVTNVDTLGLRQYLRGRLGPDIRVVLP